MGGFDIVTTVTKAIITAVFPPVLVAQLVRNLALELILRSDATEGEASAGEGGVWCPVGHGRWAGWCREPSQARGCGVTFGSRVPGGSEEWSERACLLRFSPSPRPNLGPSTALSVADGARDALLGRPVAVPSARTKVGSVIERGIEGWESFVVARVVVAQVIFPFVVVVVVVAEVVAFQHSYLRLMARLDRWSILSLTGLTGLRQRRDGVSVTR